MTPVTKYERRHLAGLGDLRGRIQGNIAVFHDIPYAAPPTGPLRFQPPMPPLAWQNERDATHARPIAPQAQARAVASMGPIDVPQDEDCLTLTVWAPAGRQGKVPVLVWIHGGGFSTGAASLPWYDGGDLASRHDVVVVGINYRLGALGFLSIGELLPGNLALLDQVAALRWVQAYIESFGGDPDRVTVMGQSGGAHNIVSLLTMEGTEGLFGRAVLQSAPLGIGLLSAADARARAQLFLNHLDLSVSSPNLLQELRAASVTTLLDAQAAASAKAARLQCGDLRTLFMPTESAPHTMLGEAHIETAVKSATARGIDVLIGWTRDEASIFYVKHPMLVAMTDEELEAVAVEICGAKAAEMLEEARIRRAGAQPGLIFLELVTDACFRQPALRMAEGLMRGGGQVFVYQFDWESPKPDLGACHCIDLPFVFGSSSWRAFSKAPMLAGADEEAIIPLSREVMERWVGFATQGSPGFPAWSPRARPILHFNSDTRVEGG